jgi:hypothetical protein
MKFMAAFNTFLRDEVNLNQTRLDRLQGSMDTIEMFMAGHPTFADSFLNLTPAGSWVQRAVADPERLAVLASAHFCWHRYRVLVRTSRGTHIVPCLF